MLPSVNELKKHANHLLVETGHPPLVEPYQRLFVELCPEEPMISWEDWNFLAFSESFYEVLVLWWLLKNWVSPTAPPGIGKPPFPPSERVLSDILRCAQSNGIRKMDVHLLVGFFVSIQETWMGNKIFGVVNLDVIEPKIFFQVPTNIVVMLEDIAVELRSTSWATPDVPSKKNRGVLSDLLYNLRACGIEARAPQDLGNTLGLVNHIIACSNHGLTLIEMISTYESFSWVPMYFLKKRIKEDGQLNFKTEKEFFEQEIEKLKADPSYPPPERFTQLVKMAWEL